MIFTAYVLASVVHDSTRTQVAVINGPETGKIGTILRVVRESGAVLVDGVRLRERCVTFAHPRTCLLSPYLHREKCVTSLLAHPLRVVPISSFSTIVTCVCAVSRCGTDVCVAFLFQGNATHKGVSQGEGYNVRDSGARVVGSTG